MRLLLLCGLQAGEVYLRLQLLLGSEKRSLCVYSPSDRISFILITMIDSIIVKLFTSSSIGAVLDMGTGRGDYALYCAEHGSCVDAVDKESIPDRLKRHANIFFFNQAIEQWQAPHNKKYDLIILRCVAHYIKHKILFEKVFPELLKSLALNGFLYITSVTPVEGLRFAHSPSDIKDGFSTLNLCFFKESVITEGCPPDSPHKFWYFLFQNNKPQNKCTIDFSAIK